LSAVAGGWFGFLHLVENSAAKSDCDEGLHVFKISGNKSGSKSTTRQVESLRT